MNSIRALARQLFRFTVEWVLDSEQYAIISKLCMMT